MTTGIVTSLHLYPIKSCRGIDVDEATVGATGLVGDRRWQVSSGKGPVTQRKKPALATVQPEPMEGGLRLQADGHPTIEVALPEPGTETRALTGLPVAAGDAGDEAAAWFAAVLDDPDARLFALPLAGGLVVPAEMDLFDGQPIAFGDLAPVLVANTASLDWLVARADEPFGMDRFRANVVVETTEPFAEDTWARFSLGQAELRHGSAWPRCAVPQVDQITGERNKEPARVLAAHRKLENAPGVPDPLKPSFEGSAVFGVGCAIGPEGTVIRVGDELQVAETCEPVPAPPA